MVKRRVLKPIPVLDEALLLKALRDEGIKELHARAIWNYALAEGKAYGSDANFENFEKTDYHMNTPAQTGRMLREKFAILTSTVVEKQVSEDGTVKLLVRLQDGQMVETVIISHGGTHPRTTLCVSSQVGCQMACTFCATGTMGLKGDLSAGEILEQVLHASRVSPIRNVVFMGMGEPLNNYDAVLAAIRGMSDSRMFKLSPKHITLSTVGVVPRMRQLTMDAPETQLALSLHAPNQELRNKIVPSARAYHLDKLIDALDGHLRGPTSSSAARSLDSSSQESKDKQRGDGAGEGSTVGNEEGEFHIAGVFTGGKGAGRRALIEYVMLAGVNDTEECGRQLGELLKGRNVVVNLIPYNPTYAPGSEEFKEPTEEALQSFKTIVHDDYGLLVTIRRHHGRDIDGACGQLAVRVVGKGATSGGKDTSCGGEQVGGKAPADIEDLVSKNGKRGGRGTASRRKQGSGLSGRRTGEAARSTPADRVDIFVGDDENCIRGSREARWGRGAYVSGVLVAVSVGMVLAVTYARARRR